MFTQFVLVRSTEYTPVPLVSTVAILTTPPSSSVNTVTWMPGIGADVIASSAWPKTRACGNGAADAPTAGRAMLTASAAITPRTSLPATVFPPRRFSTVPAYGTCSRSTFRPFVDRIAHPIERAEPKSMIRTN